MSIEEHRQKFESKVLEEQEKEGQNSIMLTKEHFDETVKRLKILENVGEQRNLSDFNLMRIFALQVNGYIIEKLVKPGTQLRFVHLRTAANKQSQDGGQGFVNHE